MFTAPFKSKLLGVIQAINPVNKDGFDDNDLNLFRVFPIRLL